jgi:hypothetical protein
MKNFTLLALFIFIAASTVHAGFSGGTGTSDDPYQITTPAQLDEVRIFLGAGIYFIQMNDIDLTTYLASGGAGFIAWGAYGWLPIGDLNTQFKGNYNGNGKKITGLTINRTTTDYVGLFGDVSAGGTVQNLGVEIASGGVNGQERVGGLVGQSSAGTVSNCYTTGSVNGTRFIGGLVGWNNTSSVSNCYATGAVGAGSSTFLGGLVGFNGASITNYYATGVVSGSNVVGGLVGDNGTNGIITKCYAIGAVSSPSWPGGLVGYDDGASITNCYWDVITTGQAASSGSDAATYGKTTTEMKTQSTYTGWDFVTTPIWEMVGTNYPRLKAIPDGALPVELTSFSANISGSIVSLNWNTATEVNNYGFEVEKQSSINNWSKIGFVEGNGTTNAPKSYSFLDKSVSGKISYRLKQIDRDGKFEYSKVIEAEVVAAPKVFGLEQNFPNPFNPSTVINYSITHASNVVLKVYDILGGEVATLVTETKSPGSYSVIFNASALANGVYFYRLNAGQLSDVKRLTVMK